MTAHSPIFLGGAGRSGTTLLRLILDSHSRIICGPEIKVLPMIARQRKQIGSVLGALPAWPSSSAYLDWLYRNFITGLLDPCLVGSGKARIAEKTPNNAAWFPVLGRIFPDSPLIHVIRDGRDVAASLLKVDWIDELTGELMPYCFDPQVGAAYWKNIVTMAREARTRDTYLEIRYEDLVTDPENTLRRLFRHIQEPWEDQVLDYANRPHSIAPGEETVKPKISTASLGRWRVDLSQAQIAAVIETAGDLLRDLGYADSALA